MLTRAGWAVVGGAIAAALGGRMFGVTELFVLAAVAGALVVLAVVWVRRPIPRLAVQRRVNPPQLTAGGVGRVEVSITNHGPRRLPPITIVDPVEGTVGAHLAVGPLDAGTKQDVGYRLPPLRRGQLHVGPLATVVTDPFGLARRRLPGVAEQAITVLPAIDPAPSLPLGGGRHEPLAGLSRRASAAAGAEDLVTLRPYVVGDDLRRVHWPSTAHADDLQVRRDEERWQGHVAVLLDTRSDAIGEAEFERAISAAAGIVDAVAATGDRVRLATTAGMDSGMVDAARAGHGLLEDLALVRRVHDAGIAVPTADVRRPVARGVLTGAEPGALPAAVRDAGFGDVHLVHFTDGGGVDDGARMTVVDGEPFAEAWRRAARVAAT
ncbi:MAG: DUF58 domain-containing protein [Aquihabitans sp.]